ncbi:hypothetical protein L6164_026721 [Bauhinia variegata]|uniref:Uncharacterized protein n=1 Tax=Bauhinia variegata TaxID=167791 RepID=A0ACB9LR44_BAUVA|nr:hypothetical protein L6164_026721 [Bauhinia variegata]
MENVLGLLKLRIKKGINLAIRDTRSSDPYVVVHMAEQKLKTRVVNDNINPEWNEELTLSVRDVNIPIQLTVFDKDTFSVDDKMGDAEIDMRPYAECVKMGLDQSLPDGTAVKKVIPCRSNSLAEESPCVWRDGKLIQEMILRLKNVECGEIVAEIEWVDIPGCKGLADVEIIA